MKKAAILCILLLLLCTSCEFFQQQTWPNNVNVVCIGLNYQGTDVDSHGNNQNDGVLYGTLNDAKELHAAFGQLYGSRLKTSTLLLQKGGNNGSYDAITSSLPTKANVMDTLSTLPSADLTIITYSGHGYNSGELVLAPPDAVSDPTYGTKGCIYQGLTLRPDCLLDLPTLFSLLDGIEGKVLLVLDSCYSGNAVEENGGGTSLVTSGDPFEKAWNSYWGDLSYQTHLYALTATTSDNSSWDAGKTSDHPHGHFCEAFLDGLGWDHANLGLRGTAPARDGNKISLDGMYLYIKSHQKIALSGSGVHQHPMLFQGPDTLTITTL